MESPLDLIVLFLKHLGPTLPTHSRVVSCLVSRVSIPFGSKVRYPSALDSFYRKQSLGIKLSEYFTYVCLYVTSGPSRPIFQSTHGRAQPCGPACPALASSNSSASQSELSSSFPPGFPPASNTSPGVGSPSPFPCASLRQIISFLSRMRP